MLLLDNGQTAWGDCAAVQYSGAGGRDPLFLSEDYIPLIKKYIVPVLKDRNPDSFRQLAGEIDEITIRLSHENKTIHTAIRYGFTQAILDAAAKSRNMLMTEVLALEYNTQVSEHEIPIFTQSGDERYTNADKMILKRADIIPHGLINNLSAKLGYNGELLLDYVRWLNKRVEQLKPDSEYKPVFHLDVYGTIGIAFNNNTERIIKYLSCLEKAAYPYKLNIEGPVDAGSRESQMIALREITEKIDSEGINVCIVADEWCNTLADIAYFADNRAGHMIQIKTPDLGGINNTIEAILYCKKKGIGAYQGGTCNETDRSARVCVHIAMAAKPDQMLAKPGMGVDEGYMIVYNEMQRILAFRKYKKEACLNE